MVSSNESQKFKVIMIGEASVGKTSILRQFTEKKFEIDIMSTIGIDFSQKEIAVENKKVQLQIWDTAGQERFHSITRAYYRGADCIILVFSLLDIRSFECLNKWLSQINEECEEVFTVIVGNKSDSIARLSKQTVDLKLEEINAERKVANKDKLKYFATSAKTGANIDQMFHYIAKELIDAKSNYKKSKNSIFEKVFKRRNCC